MAEQQKRDNSGALFINQRKELEKHPDFNGQAMIGGVEYWIAGWEKESQNGNVYFSLTFNPKEQQNSNAPASPPARKSWAPRPSGQQQDLPNYEDQTQESAASDDDIPF